MPDISADQVRHLAELARIDLSEGEVESLTAELAQIVESVATVSQFVTPDVPATSHPIAMANVFRDDLVVPGLTAEQALSGAPAREGDFFRVAPILGEEA
jgi:aspartyl-tRNA(Asn)/glutamyl-tRNA(Gln) amidotransferase subunit C